MLGKLIKHELKATARYFLPLFLIALVLTPITRITAHFGDLRGIFQVIPAVIIFAYVASLLVIAAASVILIIYRFYKSMVTEEGYLMHTLPVSTETHIWAKLLVAALWSVASVLVISLSLFMMFYTKENFNILMYGLSQGMNFLTTMYNGHVALIVIEFIILLIIGVITSPLVFYASIAIGQVLSKNKILGSVAGFFIIQIASQVLGTLSIIPFGFTIYRLDSMTQVSQQMAFFSNLFMPYLILIALVSGVVLFLITDLIFKKKLNLE